MNPWPVRVIKVGGSLLEFDLLPSHLALWLKKQPPTHNILIAGGGSLADAIRNADRRFALGEAVSHALCLEVMRVTAGLLQAILTRGDEPTISVTRGFVSLKELLAAAITAPLTTIFDAGEFMQHEEARFPPSPLPHTWDVTSDSIAARIATLLAAEELVLLKSATPPECSRLATSENGFVDRYFAKASLNIPVVRIVNLRTSVRQIF